MPQPEPEVEGETYVNAGGAQGGQRSTDADQGEDTTFCHTSCLFSQIMHNDKRWYEWDLTTYLSISPDICCGMSRKQVLKKLISSWKMYVRGYNSEMMHSTRKEFLFIVCLLFVRLFNLKKGGCICGGDLYLHTCQVRVTIGDSGVCCCTCVTSFER